MSSETKKTGLFIKEVVARITGDDAQATAAKIARKAVSAVDSQLAALRAEKVTQEDNVDTAKELLKDAKFPKELITDSRSYIAGIERAQKALDAAQEDLDNVEESIKYFEALSEMF